MNIKEHIEAGHYPKDERGRALVPRANGETVVIYATDAPKGQPIVGHDGDGVGCWGANGYYDERNGDGARRLNLLPPPPRKVEVKAYGYAKRSTGELVRPEIDDPGPPGFKDTHCRVELTGSYEEEWK